MAAPTVRDVTAPVITTGAINQPSTTQVGDLVIFFLWSQGNSVIPTHTLQSGFTTIRTGAHNDGSTDGRLSIGHRVATQAGTVALTPYTVGSATANQTCGGAVTVTTGTFDVSTAPTNNGISTTNNGAPNPPAIAALTGDVLVFAVGAWHVTSAASTVTSPPTNYTERLDGPAGSHVTHLAVATRALTSLSGATEDPAAFSDNVAPNGATAMTFAIQGAVAVALGTAAIALGVVAAAGSGTVQNPEAVGTAAITLGALTGAGTATVDIVGTAGLALSVMSTSAAGKIDVAGTGTNTFSTVTLAGAAGVAVQGDAAALMFGLLTVDATGASGFVPVEGAAHITLGAVTATAAVTTEIRGSAAMTLNAVTGVGSGVLDVQGAGSTTLGTMTASSAGQVYVAAATSTALALLSIDGAVTVEAHGSANVSLGVLTLQGEATGLTVSVATAIITLSSPVVTALGDVDVQGTTDAALGLLSADSSGQVDARGALMTTFAPMTVTGEGEVPLMPITGSANITFDSLTLVGSGGPVSGLVIGSGSVTVTVAGRSQHTFSVSSNVRANAVVTPSGYVTTFEEDE